MAYNQDYEGGGYVPPDTQSAPQSDPFYDQITALYAEFGRTPTPQEVEAHRGNPGGIDAIRAMLQRDQPAPVANTGSAGETGAVGGGGYTTIGAGLGGAGTLTAPFTGTFTQPSTVQAGSLPYIPATPSYTAPQFTPPTYKPPPAFELPTYEQAGADPGYQFTLKQGEQALQQSAAARGLANTGGTAKDLINYGQAAGTTQYNNVLNRMLNQYLTNYQTQYMDPYNIAFQGAQASFAPQMAGFQANVGAGNLGYSTQAAAGQRANEFNYQSAWDRYLQDFNQFRDQRDSTYNKVRDVYTS